MYMMQRSSKGPTKPFHIRCILALAAYVEAEVEVKVKIDGEQDRNVDIEFLSRVIRHLHAVHKEPVHQHAAQPDTHSVHTYTEELKEGTHER